MKKIFYLVIAVFMITKAEAQRFIPHSLEKNKQEASLKKDTVAKMTFFSATQIEDTVYLCWKIKDLHHDGIFIVYSSADGKEFSIVGTKNAIGVPIHTEIAYYMEDKEAKGKTYYKVTCVNALSEFLSSENISAEGDKPMDTDLGLVSKKCTR